MATGLQFEDELGNLRLSLHGDGWRILPGFNLGDENLQTETLHQAPHGEIPVAHTPMLTEMFIPLRAYGTFAQLSALHAALAVELRRPTNILRFTAHGSGHAYLIDTYRSPVPTLIRAAEPVNPAMSRTGFVDLIIKRDPDLRTPGSSTPPTFTRASVAYLSDGTEVASGEPRFEDGQFGKGILVEEPTENLLSAAGSQAFAAAYWTKTNCTLVTGQTDPGGGTTAEKLVENAGTGTKQATRAALMTTSSPGAWSVIAKAGERSRIIVAFGGVNQGVRRAFFDLAAGTMPGVGANISASITPVGGGWYRCAVHSATVDSAAIAVGLSEPGVDDHDYTGDGTSGVYLWHPQAEAKAWATTWQIGETPRAAELTELPDVTDPAASTVHLSVTTPYLTPFVGIRRVYELSLDGDNALRLLLSSTNVLSIRTDVDGAFEQDLASFSLDVGQDYRVAIRYDNGTVTLFIDGAEAAAFVHDPLPAGTYTQTPGSTATGTVHANAILDDLTIYNEALPDSEIAAIYASGAPAPISSSTVYKLGFDDTLVPLTGAKTSI